MKRSDFIKNVGAAAIAPFLLKSAITLDEEAKLIKINGNVSEIAVDVHALKDVGSNGKVSMSAADVLRLFKETGVLVYRTPYYKIGDQNYSPLTVISTK